MEEGPLKLYVHKAFVAPQMSYTTLLYPIWGLGVKKEMPIYLTESLNKWGFDPACFTLVDTPEEAEYILVPHEYWRLKRRRPDLLQKNIELAQRYNKPLLIDAAGDEAGVITIPNARILRINQYRFEVQKNEIKIPVLCEDLLQTYGQGKLTLIQKSTPLSIGFVGWGRLSFKQRMRSFVKEIPIRIRGLFDTNYKTKIKGVFWREKANAVFQKSARIKTDFIIRSSYSGHSKTVQGDPNKSRKEFVNNLLHNPYALVVRGDANEATRFYEALSLGRIPVLIDTAVVLPLENLINYKEFCVIIDHRYLKRAPDILADFHSQLTNEQFIEMQKKAREVFEKYLRLDSFSKYLVELLRNPII